MKIHLVFLIQVLWGFSSKQLFKAVACCILLWKNKSITMEDTVDVEDLERIIKECACFVVGSMMLPLSRWLLLLTIFLSHLSPPRSFFYFIFFLRTFAQPFSAPSYCFQKPSQNVFKHMQPSMKRCMPSRERKKSSIRRRKQSSGPTRSWTNAWQNLQEESPNISIQ